MRKIEVKDVPKEGAGSFFMQKLFFGDAFEYSLVTILPGDRIPKEGYSCHGRDEYSYFVSGGLMTGDGPVCAGEATFIPRGEKHWCRNLGTEPAVLVCAMVGDSHG